VYESIELLVTEGLQKGARIELEPASSYRLGSSYESDIVIRDAGEDNSLKIEVNNGGVSLTLLRGLALFGEQHLDLELEIDIDLYTKVSIGNAELIFGIPDTEEWSSYFDDSDLITEDRTDIGGEHEERGSWLGSSWSYVAVGLCLFFCVVILIKLVLTQPEGPSMAEQAVAAREAIEERQFPYIDIKEKDSIIFVSGYLDSIQESASLKNILQSTGVERIEYISVLVTKLLMISRRYFELTESRLM
jgi:hypothetical protein